jgi:hypothetical protein
VTKKPGDACEEKVQCSDLGAGYDCVEKKCTSKETGKEVGDSQEESGKLNDGFCLICTYVKMNRFVK